MWGYDPSVQLLAVEGYAVLQINFRGSTGYGTKFRDAGYGEWGRKTQEDIIDATYWAIKEGIADKERIAIFGASFGGYSALQAPILEPDLYKAAIGYVGVYDLDMLYTTGDIETARWGEAYLDTTLPDNEADRIAQSPARNVDKLKAAVFIVHGVDDYRAAFEHAEALRDALDEINYPYEWLAKDGEGHGFYDVDNRIELNNKVLAFLEKHLN
jgi:dipeptidyl aminopeptidase/acylaminoacyl peptidase